MFDWLLSFLIRIATLLVLLGWLLSACSFLSPIGYIVTAVPAVAFLGFVSFRNRPREFSINVFRHVVLWLKHYRFLPLVYILVCPLIFIGAIIHTPNNFDGLSYRVPRMFYWLEHHGWYWIDSPFTAVNYPLPNYEWLSTPLFLLSGELHLLVLINLISFLLIPPLLFRLLRAFGVSTQLAYDWAWIFPCGYIIAMEAGGIGNDLLGMTAILAALYCAGRFIRCGKRGYLFDALLAAGLCTGVKISNLPLAGLVLIVLFKNAKALWTQRKTLIGGVVVGISVSALIPLVLNFTHTGSILGVPKHLVENQVDHPLAGVIGNSLIMLSTAVQPPIFPSAGKLTTLIQQSLNPQLSGWLGQHYKKFEISLNELPVEDHAGLGVGITLAFVICVAFWIKQRFTSGTASVPAATSRPNLDPWQAFFWYVWLIFSLSVLFAKLGTGSAFPRNMTPWFPVLLATLLGIFGRRSVARSSLWKGVAVLASLSILPALLLTPSRPLVPSSTTFEIAKQFGIREDYLERLKVVYSVYAHRDDPFEEIRSRLPESAKRLALVSDGQEPTSAWWKPYGTRSCFYLRTPTDIASARASGVEFAVLKEPSCLEYFSMDIPRWCEVFRAQPVATMDVRIYAALPPIHYTLIRFLP